LPAPDRTGEASKKSFNDDKPSCEPPFDRSHFVLLASCDCQPMGLTKFDCIENADQFAHAARFPIRKFAPNRSDYALSIDRRESR
jgi:hypothetical protein